MPVAVNTNNASYEQQHKFEYFAYTQAFVMHILCSTFLPTFPVLWIIPYTYAKKSSFHRQFLMRESPKHRVIK